MSLHREPGNHPPGRDQVSILTTFYEQLLHQFPLTQKLQTQIVSTYVSSELNVGEIKYMYQLHQHFSYSFFCNQLFSQFFLYLQFVFVIFRQEEIGKKGARKMLLKLAPEYLHPA
jgi:hypothetical protein